MIAAPILSLLLQATAPSAAPSPPPPAPAEAALAREDLQTLFFFYRLDYFHDVAVDHPCRRADPDQMRALDERYDALHRELVARFGAARVDVPDRDRPQSEPDPGCGMGFIFPGYANALAQLEQHLAGTGR